MLGAGDPMVFRRSAGMAADRYHIERGGKLFVVVGLPELHRQGHPAWDCSTQWRPIRAGSLTPPTRAVTVSRRRDADGPTAGSGGYRRASCRPGWVRAATMNPVAASASAVSRCPGNGRRCRGRSRSAVAGWRSLRLRETRGRLDLSPLRVREPEGLIGFPGSDGEGGGRCGRKNQGNEWRDETCTRAHWLGRPPVLCRCVGRAFDARGLQTRRARGRSSWRPVS